MGTASQSGLGELASGESFHYHGWQRLPIFPILRIFSSIQAMA
jgi:hypothetical protein